MRGTVRTFDARRGFGFITADTGASVFVHATAVAADMELHPGVVVWFRATRGARGQQALQVRHWTAPDEGRCESPEEGREGDLYRRLDRALSRWPEPRPTAMGVIVKRKRAIRVYSLPPRRAQER